MSEFLDAAFTLPTAIFSVLLILVGLYWLITLLGFLDLGMLDGLLDFFEGAADGAADGLLDGALEGAAEGLGEGTAEGLADGDSGGGCLALFGGVPVTITGSLFVVFGWVFTYFGMDLVTGSAAAAAASSGVMVAVGVGSLVASLGVTALAIRPLRNLFRAPKVTRHGDLVGRTCTITTSSVDPGFGQAEVIDDGGSAILIQARCRQADNSLGRGSQALVYDYDREREVFLVAPLDDDLKRASADQPTG